MTKSPRHLAAFALAVLMTAVTVAGVNRLATAQYAVADTLAMAPYGQTHVAVQHVTVIGHRATA